MENLSTTSFARDYHMTTELAATRDGRLTALRVHVIADHGAFDACAAPTKFPAGFFNIVTGSYDIPTAFVSVDGVYTNKATGRRRLSLLVPGHRSGLSPSSGRRTCWRKSSTWTRSNCG